MQEKIHTSTAKTPKTPTPEESVQIIDKMMELTRHSVKEGYWYFFLFGILVIFASLVHLILLQLSNPQAGAVWSILFVGGIAAAIKSIKDEKNGKAHPIIYSFVWLAASFTYVTVLIGAAKINGNAYLLINPIIFSLAGGATFLTGKLMQFKPFVIGGVFIWIIANVQLFVSLETQLLLNILSVTVGYLIPAYLLEQS